MLVSIANSPCEFPERLEKIDESLSINGSRHSSVTNKTDYVIAGNKSGSKLEKAKLLDIKILNENEFIKKVNQ